MKQAKKKASGEFKSSVPKFREPTGEKQLFEEIASERDWVCFVTGKALTVLTATQFLHVLPKALNKYPKFKLHKKNIVIATNEVHYLWDHTPRSELRKSPLFKRLFDLEKELMDDYKNL